MCKCALPAAGAAWLHEPLGSCEERGRVRAAHHGHFLFEGVTGVQREWWGCGSFKCFQQMFSV